MEIKHRWSDKALFTMECETIRECVESAVAQKINLSDANLIRANLSNANLRYANLRYANLKTNKEQK